MTGVHPAPEAEDRNTTTAPPRRPLLQAIPVHHGGQVTLVLVGDLDLSTAAIVRDAVAAALRERPHALTLDCSALAFCDVCGLRALRAARDQATAHQAALHILAPDPCLRRLLILAQAEDLLAAIAEPRPRTAPAPQQETTGPLARALALARDAQQLHRQGTERDVLTHAGRLATTHVPGATTAAVTLLGPSGEPETLATDTNTNAIALAAENAHGPARRARTRHSPLHIPDIAGEQRWPEFTAQARALGITAALICDLGHHHGSQATLSVYTTAPHGFDPDAALYVELLAAHTEIALQRAASTTSLHTALYSRQTIGEATGILMQRHHLDARAAFALLSVTSQRTNVKLRTVAEYVVLTGANPDQISRDDLEQPHRHTTRPPAPAT